MNLDTLQNDPRVFVRRSGPPDPDGRVVIYWMRRAQRAFDNPALETAIQAANLLGLPVVVGFELLDAAHNANLRHYDFLVRGIPDLHRELHERGIGFALERHASGGIAALFARFHPALVVSDENPLRSAERSCRRAVEASRVPFWTVDADVIVPTRLLGKAHFAARTIRPRLHERYGEFFRPITQHVVRHRWNKPTPTALGEDLPGLLASLPIDRTVPPISGIASGGVAARAALQKFVTSRLAGYATHRNHPDRTGTSQLSPYLHFGQIGPHTVALAVREADAPVEDRNALLEELIVRRELAVNFVRYTSDYDTLGSAEPWAKKTIAIHRNDPRPVVYTPRQFENSDTHDDLWNAAQRQMAVGGWMHGYVRMYWAKKILEWSESPEAAFETAVTLNDRYQLDGRDPNGYAGIAWAIAGKHDRAWGPERPIYGTIRYMSYASTSRKFNCKDYVRQVKQLEQSSKV